ncbi:MAG TPA: ATP-binding cassette domain-containing protein [Steroidobacteraceae bacterium]|nr:ATP-binding cassette domain-containing protein [Steroidobacteraceae bacterium]
MVRSSYPYSRYVEVRLHGVRLDRNARRVLEDVSWTIRPGERWVLAGANGAGKTQLLKLVAGSVWPTPIGREVRHYRWKGEVWRTPQEIQDEIGYVGPERQDKYTRYGWNHTVEQVVATGIHRTDILLHSTSEADRRRVAAILRRLRIEALAGRRFLTLSYGERRLTLLARALASRPSMLLLDELLNGLDEANHERARHWLESTARSTLPWVLSTHRVEDVPASATHAIVLKHGRVVYRGAIRRAPLSKWLAQEASRATTRSRSRSRGGESPTRTLVRLTNACVHLDEHVALQDISLAIHGGDCWVVHGHNGSGKTTLLRTLYGDHGVAVGGGIERAGIERGVPLQVFKERVGLVAPHLQADHPQDLTAGAVVQSGRHASIGLNDEPSAADRAAARRALREFGLSSLAARAIRELSYGQLRRVLFARAWVRDPALLLLDEPFSGVDEPTRRDLSQRIEAKVAGGTAVVMTTHRRSEWPRCASHELELAGGRVRYAGPLRERSRSRRRTPPGRRSTRRRHRPP